jgi:hypothetical protein
MPRTTKGTYYLGRIIKLGELDDEKVIDAILDPKPIVRRKNAWTFIDAQRLKDGAREYVFARLSKYSPEAEVKVIDPALRAELRREEPNLSIAASPFVYIPLYSGIAFLHVSQHIEQRTFSDRFCRLVQERYESFFVECQMEPISDLRTFASKLLRLEGIFRLFAKLYPPNPIFGPLWRHLKGYMEDRGTDTLQIQEEAKGAQPLHTDLPRHVDEVAKQTDNVAYVPRQELPIGDAAILMAADGYGTGLVEGRQGDQSVVIRTTETVRNFRFDRDPDPAELYQTAAEIFEEIQRQRHMEH